MESIEVLFTRFTEVFVAENDGPVVGVSPSIPISFLGRETTRPVDSPTDAAVLSEIKARLVQDGWISGRGFLY
jgi:hypothetical protein